MGRMNVAEDIKPVSEFRARTAAVIEQVRRSQRPVVLTQHGRGAVVLLDVRAYEALREELELLRDLRTAEAQLDRGEGVDHAEARRRILEAAQR